MDSIALKDAEHRLEELARRVEQGETITLTRDGQPVLDLVPHQRRGGVDWEGLERAKRQLGVEQIVTYIADDFDDPLPEDFLLKPLPDPAPCKT